LKRRGRSDKLDDICRRIVQFRDERDWKQFHDPKNLAEAISVEAGELLESFLWKTPNQSRSLPPDKLEAVKSEIADVLIFLLYLAEELRIDPVLEAKKKLALNEQRYPVSKSKGSSLKHSELGR
jgi:NTP pyrophosphatase (non-canonical NTP hydrolase)